MTTQHPAEPPHPPTPQPASVRARIAAKLIDLTITAAIAFIALTYFALATLNIFVAKQYTDAEAYAEASLFLGVLLYEAAMIATTAWRGKTPGKKLLGIQVIAYNDSPMPSALRSIIRWAIPLAATAPLVDAFIRNIPELANNEHAAALSGRVWWLWVALGWWLLVHISTRWDSQRRGWHDKAAGTIVIYASRPHDPGQGHDLFTKWQRQRYMSSERYYAAVVNPIDPTPSGAAQATPARAATTAATPSGAAQTTTPSPAEREPTKSTDPQAPTASTATPNDAGHGIDYINGGPDTDTCTRGDTTAGCESRTDTP